MPKALITNRIYLDDPGVEVTKKIAKELTYKFIKRGGTSTKFTPIEVIKNYRILAKNIISVPQARLDLIPEGYEIIDRRVVEFAPFPKPLYELYPEQLEVYEQVDDNAIINALVGWGKSYTALWIAKKLEQKTLIITHSTALRDQWISDIKVLFGIDCGIIGSGTIDYEDHFITVANTQTLVKHVDKVAKEFGLVILDEMHHIAATSFSNILDKMHSRYKLGLSGTLIRKDGKEIMFQDYFGFNVLKPAQSNTMTPTVKLVKTNVGLTPDIPWTERISQLVADVNYQKFIASVAKAHMDMGHCVLVIADRVDFLKVVSELIGDRCALVTGNLGDRDLVKEQILNREKDCIAGSRQIFSEGISINRLSCVILAIPINNDSLLEQIVGRIQRKYDDTKLTPLVLDMQFTGWADRKQNESRLGFYLKKGWQVEVV